MNATVLMVPLPPYRFLETYSCMAASTAGETVRFSIHGNSPHAPVVEQTSSVIGVT
jgi:hypothetical protein